MRKKQNLRKNTSFSFADTCYEKNGNTFSKKKKIYQGNPQSLQNHPIGPKKKKINARKIRQCEQELLLHITLFLVVVVILFLIVLINYLIPI